MAFVNHTDGKMYESKLDLDYDTFLTKKIDRCDDCGDIYYSGTTRGHNCNQKKQRMSPGAEPRALGVVENFEINQLNALLGIRPVIERVWFHDEIHAIWKRKNFPRHAKPEAQEQPPRQESHEKDKFSFSPYDNFF